MLSVESYKEGKYSWILKWYRVYYYCNDFNFIYAWDSILNSNINILNLMTQIGLINHGFCIEGDNAKYLNIEW